MEWKQGLKTGAVLVSDGAWGTEITKLGLTPGEAPEKWNLDKPENIKEVARRYVESGSDIILTNTFGANRIKLEKMHLEDLTRKLNEKSVEISLSAAETRALVFASIGPTGELMAPYGQREEEEFIDCYAEQIAACVNAGAHGIVIESMSDLREALAAYKAARQVSSLPVVVCMTYEKGKRGFATAMGDKPETAAAFLEKAGVDIIGSNCGSGIENMVEIAKILRSVTVRPLWIKPNAGLPELVKGKTVYMETPEKMAARVKDLILAGANIVGGCCGTGPEHIREIRREVDRNRPQAIRINKAIIEALDDSGKK